MWGGTPFTPALGRQKQADEFRLAWSTEFIYTVSKLRVGPWMPGQKERKKEMGMDRRQEVSVEP